MVHKCSALHASFDVHPSSYTTSRPGLIAQHIVRAYYDCSMSRLIRTRTEQARSWKYGLSIVGSTAPLTDDFLNLFEMYEVCASKSSTSTEALCANNASKFRKAQVTMASLPQIFKASRPSTVFQVRTNLTNVICQSALGHCGYSYSLTTFFV